MQHNTPTLACTFMRGVSICHSTDTALLRVTNDILPSADLGHFTILLLLDFTAAFDTISHTVLLSRLESSPNITSTALSWLKSYVTNRQQYININSCTSFTAPLSQGVPQGLVLGPPPPPQSSTVAPMISSFIFLEGCAVYLDDAVALSDMWDDHIQRSGALFSHLTKEDRAIATTLC